MDFSLCVITADLPEVDRTHFDVARAALDGGATLIQLREKNRERDDLIEIARAIRDMTREAGALFIINDDPGLAARVGADGVHVGQDDLPADEARRMLGPLAIIGLSATSPDEAARADPAVVDYVGVGPVFPTPSKDDAAPPLGLRGVAAAVQASRLPVVAIGGIDASNASQVMVTGAAGVAVISAVSGKRDMAASTRALCRLVSPTPSPCESAERFPRGDPV